MRGTTQYIWDEIHQIFKNKIKLNKPILPFDNVVKEKVELHLRKRIQHLLVPRKPRESLK